MKSDKFCIKPYNAIGCSADTYIETGALNYTAGEILLAGGWILADFRVGGKDEILKLTPARAFRVDEVCTVDLHWRGLAEGCLHIVMIIGRLLCPISITVRRHL